MSPRRLWASVNGGAATVGRPAPGRPFVRRGRHVAHGGASLTVYTAAGIALGAFAGLSVAVSPWAPIGFAALVVLVVAIWVRPVVAALIVAAAVPAIAGLARGLAVPGFKLSELLLVTCLVPLLLRRLPRWRPWGTIEYWLLAVATAGLALALLNGLSAPVVETSVIWRTGLFPGFILATWWIVSRSVSTREEMALVLRWVILASLVPAILGILQFADVLGARELIWSIVQEGVMPLPGAPETRITGPFTIAHSLGGYIIVPLILAATLLLVRNTEALSRRWLIFVVAVDTAALVLSVTITTLAWAIAAFLVAALALGCGKVALRALALTAVAATVVFFPALADRWQDQATAASGTSEGAVPQTFQFRLLVWQRDYLPLLSEAAPVGLVIQPGDVQFSSTENQYITLILRGGVVLLVLTAASILVFTRRALVVARESQGLPQVGAAALLGVLIFLPIAGLFWPYFTNAGLPQSLVGTAGAVLALEGVRASMSVRTRRLSHADP